MSWKASSAVSEARLPILSSLRLTENPGVLRSTRNIEIPRCLFEPSPPWGEGRVRGPVVRGPVVRGGGGVAGGEGPGGEGSGGEGPAGVLNPRRHEVEIRHHPVGDEHLRAV